MDVIFLIARILFSILFFLSAIGHVTQADAMAQYSSYKGAPGGKFGVILTGILMGIGGLAILLGIWGDLGSIVIAVTLVPITFFMHAFWKETDAQAKMTEQVAFNKNVALIAASLAFFVVFSADPGLTVTKSLFNF